MLALINVAVVTTAADAQYCNAPMHACPDMGLQNTQCMWSQVNIARSSVRMSLVLSTESDIRTFVCPCCTD